MRQAVQVWQAEGVARLGRGASQGLRRHACDLDDGTTAEAKVNISKQKLDLRKQQIEQARVTMQTKMREEVGRRRYTAVS